MGCESEPFLQIGYHHYVPAEGPSLPRSMAVRDTLPRGTHQRVSGENERTELDPATNAKGQMTDIRDGGQRPLVPE
ncbi:hypothetical protein F0562_019152 [Nyssa sinensis]|uniref:Uncharacterized protein n=1 Tax=Nyssa sinensis TaxID=561372 RepID=A0A5J4ZB18_9ASTE|nr:hypothetical protein F0562_019152 [Nyssa sinensis]